MADVVQQTRKTHATMQGLDFFWGETRRENVRRAHEARKEASRNVHGPKPVGESVVDAAWIHVRHQKRQLGYKPQPLKKGMIHDLLFEGVKRNAAVDRIAYLNKFGHMIRILTRKPPLSMSLLRRPSTELRTPRNDGFCDPSDQRHHHETRYDINHMVHTRVYT